MAQKNTNLIILVILLMIAAFFVQQVLVFKKLPTEMSKILEFPAKLDGYKSEERPLDERVYAVLNTDTIFFREYSKKDGLPIWFLIVYGEQDRQSFHPPEYCYLGGGDVELLSKEVEILELSSGELDVNKLLFEMPNYHQLVFYWYTAGKKMTSNYYKQQIFFVMHQLKRRKVGGTLIRVSTVVPETETIDEASQRIGDFLNLALPKIKEIL